jgi:hypothetical protein
MDKSLMRKLAGLFPQLVLTDPRQFGLVMSSDSSPQCLSLFVGLNRPHSIGPDLILLVVVVVA